VSYLGEESTILKSRYPYYLANHPKFADQGLDVVDKNTGEVSTRVSMADTTTIDQAIAGAVLLCWRTSPIEEPIWTDF